MKNWYSLTLTILGVALAIVGAHFFIVAGVAGVPVLPIVGLPLFLYGVWVVRQR